MFKLIIKVLYYSISRSIPSLVFGLSQSIPSLAFGLSQSIPSLAFGLRLYNTFSPSVSIFLFRCSINFLLYLLI